MALTKKQQLFVMEYCADPQTGKTEAARRAGFSQDRAAITACELMKNPEVLREIERNTKAKFEKIELTEQSVLDELQNVIDTATGAGAGNWQMQARLKAAELRGKYLKMWTDKVEIGIDDALIEKLREGRARVGIVEAAKPQFPAPTLEGTDSVQ